MARYEPANDEQPDDEIITEPLPEVMDPENFTPRLLALLSNALVWRESHELRRLHDLGTNDWRVLTTLSVRPGIAATEVADFTGMNKALVSKSVNTLAGRELIVLLDGPRGSRPLYLTRAGAKMHDLLLPISMRGQEIVLAPLNPAEIDELNALLRRMLSARPELQVRGGGRGPAPSTS